MHEGLVSCVNITNNMGDDICKNVHHEKVVIICRRPDYIAFDNASHPLSGADEEHLLVGIIADILH